MKGSLDTSILVQLVTGQRPELVEAVEQLVTSTKNSFDVADVALLELAFVLEKEKQLPRQNIIVLYQMLETHSTLSFNRNLFTVTLELYSKRPKLSFYDCYLSAYAEVTSALPLWTLDKKLARQSPCAELLVK